MKTSLHLSFVALLCTLFISGCGGGGGSDESSTSRLRLGVVPKSTGGEFWETVERGARRAAEELDVEIKWEGTVTETEFAEQNRIIENMINLEVDGLALAPLNQVAMKRMVDQTVDAGIPVVIFDSKVDGDRYRSFVATNNRAAGALGGSHLASLLGENGRTMVMRYVQGSGSTEDRSAGAMEALEAAGHQVLSDPYPDTGTVEGCKTAAANTLEGFVTEGRLELDGIFAANLYSTLGVLEALDDLRKGGIAVDVAFVGFDTSEKLELAVKEGAIDALVAQDPENMGYLAVKTLVAVLQDQPVEAMVDTGVNLVTAETLAE
jgi:ribose transport system substrate-binding protein